jgi:tRNA A37 methylthiotransferase MiaB
LQHVKTVLTEARNLAQSGHPEVILTGIFLGAYGQRTTPAKKWDAGRTVHVTI